MAALCSAIVLRGVACTNLIVGKNASADGSIIVSYSADDFGSFGYMRFLPSAEHVKGEMRPIYDGDTNNYLGEIEEVPYTFSVMGYMNEFQLTITETTFGGREELTDSTGILDYVSLMQIALQRTKTAREAIQLMANLTSEYGYHSEGESFTIADKNEVWIMDLIGKGPDNKGIVWVAVRIPDDCICAHANQSRIRHFPLHDFDNCLYDPDVISFAREKGYFTGADDDFSFSEAYSPADFSALRFCEARVWSYFNHFTDSMASYIEYVKGDKLDAEPMPLFVKPDRKVSMKDIKAMMRDHYEGTPFALDNDPGMGPYEAPYRPTPLQWTLDGKTYFNERPISTQQSAFVMIAQIRNWLPDYVGGVTWIGFDDANMVPFVPVYCGNIVVPECFGNRVADGLNFSFKSAFWLCNWVSSFVYPRYSLVFDELKNVRDRLDTDYANLQNETEQAAMSISGGEAESRRFLTDYTNRLAEGMMYEWMELGKRLMVKYLDGINRPEENGEFLRTAGGVGARPIRPGYPDAYRRYIVETTKDKFLIK